MNRAWLMITLWSAAGCVTHAGGAPAAASNDVDADLTRDMRAATQKAEVAGRFSPSGVKVAALVPAPCGADSCALMLVVRDADGKALAGLRTTETCDAGVALEAVSLFAGRQSVAVTCRAGAGAGYSERRLLFDALAGPSGGPVVALAIDTGSFQALSPDERSAGGCAPHPTGWIQIVGAGARPTVRVLDPSSASLEDGKGSATARDLQWDGARHAFVPTGATSTVQVDSRSPCRPD